MMTMAIDSQHHGIKRRAADTLEGEQRLAKRFNLLNLRTDNKLFIPLPNTCSNSTTTTTNLPINANSTPHINYQSTTHQTNLPPINDDFMQLDDTKDKVYIYNLDEELASTSSSSSSSSLSSTSSSAGLEGDDGKNLIFLPDIERHLIKIPKHVLTGQDPSSSTPTFLSLSPSRMDDDSNNNNNQLVLYSEPESLSVPKERDSVRKAIIESRERTRQAQAQAQIQAQAQQMRIPPPPPVNCNGAFGDNNGGWVGGFHGKRRQRERMFGFVDDNVHDDYDAMDIG